MLLFYILLFFSCFFSLRKAYRAVLVHPSDQQLLAVLWKGASFIDKALQN